MSKEKNIRIAHVGNSSLLEEKKKAFLCSRQVPASIVLKCYDWAIGCRNAGECIISGFHSQIEKDVLGYLLKGNQPIIVALARGLKKRVEPAFAQALEKNRLLVVTPFNSKVTRVTQETANKRNDFMAELADDNFVAFAQPNGNVHQLVMRWLKKGKKVSTFDVTENRALIEAGVEILCRR
jgi:predicted Rossmann fold nucleotide-binding protein DprA/Smf involved in DNA uptake